LYFKFKIFPKFLVLSLNLEITNGYETIALNSPESNLVSLLG